MDIHASSLDRLMACPGSYFLEARARENYPDQEVGPAAEEGTAAAWALEQILTTGESPVGKPAPNGWIITDAMCEHLGDLVDHIRNMTHARDTSYQCETPVNWVIGDNTIYCRPDLIWYDTHAQRLHVIDLKYGFRLIEPETSWQLRAYALGWRANNPALPLETVSLEIYQPRAYHTRGKHRRHIVSTGDTTRYLSQITELVTVRSTRLQTGTQCTYCSARTQCDAQRRSTLTAMDVSLAPEYRGGYDDLPHDALSAELDFLTAAQQTLKIRIDALEQTVTARIKSGETIPNYDLVKAFGNRKWKDGLDVAAVSAILGVDATADALATPAQVERRGADKELVAELTVKPDRAPKLKRIDINATAKEMLNNG